MELTLRQDEFEHQPGISVYNNNRYKHKKSGYIILEVCHEDENYHDLFLIEDGKEIFIGSSINGIEDVVSITLQFKEHA